MNAPPPRSPLLTEVTVLLSSTAAALRGTPAESSVSEIVQRLHEPLRVAIAGRVKAGKSTLLNALIGDDLAPTDAGECTRIVTWYRHSHTCRVTAVGRDGVSRQLPFDRADGPLEPRLGPHGNTDIARLTVEWPVPALEHLTLIDTPGMGSISADTSARTIELLTPADRDVTPADAVVYLMRHLHTSDVDFLEAFHDDEYSQPSPVDCIGVLSRADEIAARDQDPMAAAAQVAARYSADQRLRRLVQQVLPVSGLLAQAGTSLVEDEFQTLRAIAALPVSTADDLLLTVDRFANASLADAPSPQQRARLLDRLGVYGVRLAVGSIRSGRTPTAGVLADLLLEQSGIRDLRTVLLAQFSERRDVLKARSALLALDRVIVELGPSSQAEQLKARVERVQAGAHELAEMRLLDAVRRGAADIRDDEQPDVDRLLGTIGTSPRARLGLADDASLDEVRQAALETLERWRRRAESPVSSRSLAEAARVLVRTCEGIYAGLLPAR